MKKPAWNAFVGANKLMEIIAKKSIKNAMDIISILGQGFYSDMTPEEFGDALLTARLSAWSPVDVFLEVLSCNPGSVELNRILVEYVAQRRAEAEVLQKFITFCPNTEAQHTPEFMLRKALLSQVGQATTSPEEQQIRPEETSDHGPIDSFFEQYCGGQKNIEGFEWNRAELSSSLVEHQEARNLTEAIDRTFFINNQGRNFLVRKPYACRFFDKTRNLDTKVDGITFVVKKPKGAVVERRRYEIKSVRGDLPNAESIGERLWSASDRFSQGFATWFEIDQVPTAVRIIPSPGSDEDEPASELDGGEDPSELGRKQ